MERTFVGMTKRKFISIMNDRIFERNWIQHEIVPRNNSICILGKYIGLVYVESKKSTKVSNSNYHAFYKIVDIPNYGEFINLFNSFKVIIEIKEEYFIVKENFNRFRKETNQLPLTDYYFKKLSNLTGYKLIKKMK